MAEFEAAFEQVAGRFARRDARVVAQDLVAALVAPLERTNCWTIAEHAGHETPHRLRHLLGRAAWDADGVRDDVRGYAVEHLAVPGYWPTGSTPSKIEAAFIGFAPFVASGSAASQWAAAKLALEDHGRPASNSYRDPAHLAVAWRGYDLWGANIDSSGQGGEIGIGDLGGWALDLYSLWGGYRRTHPSNPDNFTLADYVREWAGAVDSGSFDRSDLMADVDSYLIAVRIENGEDFFTACRKVLAGTRSARLAEFYDRRFGSSHSNVAQCMEGIVQMEGTIAGIVGGSEAWDLALRAVCGLGSNETLPSESSLYAMGAAFGDVMRTGFES